MSDNKDNKKKGFFSRLFGRSSSPNENNIQEKTFENKSEIPSKSALNKMKKADIVSIAKDNGLDLDIKLTKAMLLEKWENHFNQDAELSSNISKEAPAEEAAPAEEDPTEEEVLAEEEQPLKVSLEEKTPAQIIKNFETKQLKEDTPDFRPGDTVAVSVKVKEGDRVRLQVFEGVVMGIKNAGLNSSFIVRKISSGIGVERTFQLHSPMIESILVKRKGDVRQAKLFYLRERSGKSARIKERLD